MSKPSSSQGQISTALLSSTDSVISPQMANRSSGVINPWEIHAAIPTHLVLFHVCKNSFQEDTLHDSLRNQNYFNQPVVPWMVLLNLFEDGRKIDCLQSLGISHNLHKPYLTMESGLTMVSATSLCVLDVPYPITWTCMGQNISRDP